MRKKLPGRSRVVAWIVGVVTAGVMVIFSIIAIAGNWNVQKSIDDALTQEIGEIQALADERIDPATGQDFTSAERFIQVYLSRQVAEPAELIVGGIPKQGFIAEKVGPRSHSFHELDPDAKAAIAVPGSGGTITDPRHGKLTWRSVSVTHSGKTGTIALVIFHHEANAELYTQLMLLLGASIVVVAATGAVAWLISGQILSFLGQFSRAVDKAIDADDHFLPEDGSEVYVSLATSANRLMETSERALDEERRFAEDITFAVRTPLALIEAGLNQPSENAAQDAEKRRTLAAEARQLNQLVEGLSVLTRISRGDYVSGGSPIDVNDVVASTATVWQHRLDDEAIPISVECGHLESPTLEVDEARLRQALDELIENAVNASHDPADVHSDKPKKVYLQTATFTRDDMPWVAIEITDFGRGIPVDERATIMQRFARASNDPRPGNGLGLAIADQIARAMGGRVDVPEPVENTTTVRLTLPLAESGVEHT